MANLNSSLARVTRPTEKQPDVNSERGAKLMPRIVCGYLSKSVDALGANRVNGSVANRKYVIVGGSGFLGTSLARHLTANGASVAIISRHPPKVIGPWRHAPWDGRTLGAWCGELNEVDGLVNLAGRTVDCVKTPDQCDEILRSRIETTRLLGIAVRSVKSPPPVWVQMSTAHIYGDPQKAVCTEGSALGYGLAPFVGRAWEEAFATSILSSQRGVVLRAGFVLGKNQGAGGGALDTLKLLARIGLGGRVGSGTQGMSWIHARDMNRLFERALADSKMQGVYVASSPNPVAQVEFMRELRRAIGMPIGLPAFSWMVRIGAPLLFGTDPELALYGRFVVSKRLEDEGFEFRWPYLGAALREIVG